MRFPEAQNELSASYQVEERDPHVLKARRQVGKLLPSTLIFAGWSYGAVKLSVQLAKSYEGISISVSF